MTASYHFCPQCLSNLPPFEYWEDDRLRSRCRYCGFPAEARVDLEAVDLARFKILVIDDDQLLLTLLSNLMTDNRLQALTASDGPSGLEIAGRERPDLILVDVMMPGMDGFEFCRQVRANPDLKGIPLIILTAMADPDLSVKGFQAGADLAVHKSSDLKKLIDTIKTALALKAEPPAA